MSFAFPSQAWTSAYQEALNSNPAYQEAGKEWTDGPVWMVIEEDQALGIESDLGMILDVDSGHCRGTQYLKDKSALMESPFVIVGPYAAWKEVIEGKIDPILSMMQGKLKLEKGHLPTIIRFVESSRQLVVSASRVPTDFAH